MTSEELISRMKQARKAYPHLEREIGKINIKITKSRQERSEMLEILLREDSHG